MSLNRVRKQPSNTRHTFNKNRIIKIFISKGGGGSYNEFYLNEIKIRINIELHRKGTPQSGNDLSWNL